MSKTCSDCGSLLVPDDGKGFWFCENCDQDKPDPDSIMGLMLGIKENVDKFNGEKVERKL